MSMVGSTLGIIVTFLIFFLTGYSARLLIESRRKSEPDPEAVQTKQIINHLIEASEFSSSNSKVVQFSFILQDCSKVTEILCVPKGMAPKLSTLCNMYIDLGMPTEILPITKDIFNKRFCVTAMKPGWNNGKRVTKFEGYINRSDSDAAKEKEHGL